MLISIVTPTFNRAHTLTELYSSLCLQNGDDISELFEWIVVDDGSTDNTSELISSFTCESKVRIKYLQKDNGGKHSALNLGLKKADGEWIIIVDSDDVLHEDAMSIIRDDILNVSPYELDKISGIIYPKYNFSGELIGDLFSDCKLLTSEKICGIRGDKLRVIRLDTMLQYPFAEINGERFLTESYVWNPISDCLPLKCLNRIVYFSDYLVDGLTNNYQELLRRNSKGTLLFVKENLKLNNLGLNLYKQACFHYRSIHSFRNSTSLLFEYKLRGLLFLILFYPYLTKTILYSFFTSCKRFFYEQH